MVLTTRKKIFFLTAVFLLNATLSFSWRGPAPSGLIQYGDNIDRERLTLLESHQIIQLAGDFHRFDYQITGTYTIQNNGGEHRATLGILFHIDGGTQNLAETGIRFSANGEQVQHTERIDWDKFVMGGASIERIGASTAWALIDVLFPSNSTVTIQVQYRTRFGAGWSWSFVSYNTVSEIGPFANLDYWRGPTKFIFEVINPPNSYGASGWIESIHFFHATDSRRDINTRAYLRNLQSLQTDLMSIERVNGNTFRIGFTEEFSSSFHRRFVIYISSSLVGEVGPFLGFTNPWREIFLSHHVNLSTQEMGPYELIFLTNAQLRIMQNAFFARHGFIFQSADLTDIFTRWVHYGESKFVFYVPNPNFHAGMLTNAERANSAIMQRLEALVRD